MPLVMGSCLNGPPIVAPYAVICGRAEISELGAVLVALVGNAKLLEPAAVPTMPPGETDLLHSCAPDLLPAALVAKTGLLVLVVVPTAAVGIPDLEGILTTFIANVVLPESDALFWITLVE